MKKKLSRRQFIKSTAKATVITGLGGYNLLIQGCSKKKEYDLLIHRGTVYDGLGNPGKVVDVAIKGGNIVGVGEKLDKGKADKLIEARGMAVSPGFIDAHAHTDVGLLANPRAESKIKQGVTTEISGNCGYSPFPIPDQIFEENKKEFKEEYGIDLNWRDINGFFNRLEQKGIAFNYGTLVGQGTIRGAVVGFDDVAPTEKELMKMKMLLAENLKAGALGLSSGLEYSPGSFAKTEELVELCRELARYEGVYATHIRDEGDYLLESIEEAIEIAKKAKVSLQISHFKVAYPRNWEKIDSVLSMVEKAKNEGVKILADRYPYIAGSTGLSFYFPLWTRQGTTQELLQRLKDPKLDKKLRSYAKQEEKKLGSWEKVVICSVFTDKNKEWEGKNILEGSRKTGKKPYDFMKDLLIQEESRVGMITFMMNEENLKRILAHPLVVLGSDGSAVADYGVLSKGKPHPRYYGTFPRVLGKYARDEKLFSLPSAIKKMTSLTAKKFGLKNRGQIKRGFFADLVIFDPDKVIDRATWGNPHQYPEGIEFVLVNGKIVINHGEHTGALPGRILKKS